MDAFQILPNGTIAPKEYEDWWKWNRVKCLSCKRFFMRYPSAFIDNNIEPICPLCYIEADICEEDFISKEING